MVTIGFSVSGKILYWVVQFFLVAIERRCDRYISCDYKGLPIKSPIQENVYIQKECCNDDDIAEQFELYSFCLPP